MHSRFWSDKVDCKAWSFDQPEQELILPISYPFMIKRELDNNDLVKQHKQLSSGSLYSFFFKYGIFKIMQIQSTPQ